MSIQPMACRTKAKGGKRPASYFVCDECDERMDGFTSAWKYCPFCGCWLDAEHLARRVKMARGTA
jgi:hypothetical protein